MSLSSFGSAEVRRHGQRWFADLCRQAGADGVEVRGELLVQPQRELPELAALLRDTGMSGVYSSPEGLWGANGALDADALQRALDATRALGAPRLKMSIGGFAADSAGSFKQLASALQAAGGNPGLARDWTAQGALDRRREVRKDLAALAAGRGQTADVVKRWLDDEPAQRLWFAAQASADEMKARADRQAPPLSSAMDADMLAQWYAAANRTRQALRGPLRDDLLLLELLAMWR